MSRGVNVLPLRELARFTSSGKEERTSSLLRISTIVMMIKEVDTGLLSLLKLDRLMV